MIVKYRTGGWRGPLIDRVECERETESSVWINGTRLAKQSRHARFWDSWEEARAHLMYLAELRVHSARKGLELANAELGNVKGLKKP